MAKKNNAVQINQKASETAKNLILATTTATAPKLEEVSIDNTQIMDKKDFTEKAKAELAAKKAKAQAQTAKKDQKPAQAPKAQEVKAEEVKAQVIAQIETKAEKQGLTYAEKLAITTNTEKPLTKSGDLFELTRETFSNKLVGIEGVCRTPLFCPGYMASTPTQKTAWLDNKKGYTSDFKAVYGLAWKEYQAQNLISKHAGRLLIMTSESFGNHFIFIIPNKGETIKGLAPDGKTEINITRENCLNYYFAFTNSGKCHKYARLLAKQYDLSFLSKFTGQVAKGGYLESNRDFIHYETQGEQWKLYSPNGEKVNTIHPFDSLQALINEDKPIKITK